MTSPTRPVLNARQPGPTLAALAAAAAWACIAGPAGAETSPYYIGASQTFSRESNLLRLLDGQATPDGFSKSDTLSSTALVGGIDQNIGRQRIFGSGEVRSNRYDKNGLLDYTGYSASAGLDWSTIERLSGSVLATASRGLQNINSGEIGFQNQKNLESVESLTARANLGLVTQYTLELNGGRRQGSNSLDTPDIQSREYRQDNVGIGVRWRPSAITDVGVSVNHTKGRYPKFRTDPLTGQFVEDRFKRNDVSLSAGWRPTGASSFDGILSTGRTRYDLNSQRDFSGLTGSFNWLWQATGKISVKTGYSRDTGQESYATAVANIPSTSDYSRVVDTLSTLASYDFSAKIAFTAGATYYKRDLVRTIDNPLIPISATGQEETTFLSLGGRWTPQRYLQLGCNVGQERRTGKGDLGTSMKSTTAGCFGQITLR